MKSKITFAILTAIAVASVTMAFSFSNEEAKTQGIEQELITFVPADISKAFPEYDVEHNYSYAKETKIDKVKNKIKATVLGTVVDIGQPVVWVDPTINPDLVNIIGERIKVDVQIEVEKSKKSNYKKGEIVTVTLLGSISPDGTVLTFDNDDEYELGENVIVHIAEDPNDIVQEDLLYVKLGKYGKYHVQDGKAFNENHKSGKSIEKALKEAQ